MHIIMHFNFLCEAFRSFLVFFFFNIVSNAVLYIFMGEVLSAHLINSVLISLEIEEMGKQFEEAFIRQEKCRWPLHIKSCTLSLPIIEMHIQTTMRLCDTSDG